MLANASARGRPRKDEKRQRLTTVHLLTGYRGIGAVGKADKSEALCAASLAVLGQEDARDVPVSREHIPQVVLLGELADVCDAQGSQVVALVLAAAAAGTTHPLARHAGLASQVRRHVAAPGTDGAQAASTADVVLGPASCRARLALGRHRVLEGALARPVLARAYPALDLGVLQARLLLLNRVLLLHLRRLPVDRGAEDDVLGDGGRVCLRAGGLALLLAELGPVLALCHARVDDLLDHRLADPPRRLDLLAPVVDAVCGYRFRAVFVLGYGLRREGGDGVVVFLFGPVGSSVEAG